MYSIQSLWTAARYQLPILFFILCNGEYRILKHNLDSYRQRFETGANQPYIHMDLDGPSLGFADMATGMGVGSARAESPEALREAIEQGLASNGPYLVEVAIEGKR